MVRVPSFSLCSLIHVVCGRVDCTIAPMTGQVGAGMRDSDSGSIALVAR
jgi:hypothetical protein